jgi:16S rRNA (cytosine1402-N4)-methyltransferase
MLDQVLQLLEPRPGGRYVDLTLGQGGHARRILEESSPDGELLGVDRDPDSLHIAVQNLASFGDRLHVVQGRFSELPRYLKDTGWRKVDGMLADLGVSSGQLTDPARGFSFQQTGPLDMRMDPSGGEPLDKLLDQLDVAALSDVLRRFADVSQPRRAATRILRAHREGKLESTDDLARAAAFAGTSRRSRKIHPATQVFLALRIMVNQELDELAAILDRLPEPLEIGGRIVFISFHSKEDRLVKNRIKDLQGRCTCPPGLPVCQCVKPLIMRSLVRRPLKPSSGEMQENPRARSARMRAAERAA